MKETVKICIFLSLYKAKPGTISVFTVVWKHYCLLAHNLFNLVIIFNSVTAYSQGRSFIIPKYNPAPELSGENMDLLSGSLAQLRRFSAASHQGPDDLTCTGPSVAARSRKPLYSSWVHEFSHEFFHKFTLWSAHLWTLTRAHWTLGNEQCKAMWKGTPAHFCGRHLSPLGIPDALPMCSQFPVEPCCLFSCIQAVIGTTALCTGIMV